MRGSGPVVEGARGSRSVERPLAASGAPREGVAYRRAGGGRRAAPRESMWGIDASRTAATRLFAIVGFVALCLTGTSCAILELVIEQTHEGGGATLGQAARAASDSSGKVRREPDLDVGETRTRSPVLEAVLEGGDESEIAPDEEAGEAAATPGYSPPLLTEHFRRRMFGVIGGVGMVRSGFYEQNRNIGLGFGGYLLDRVRADGYARYGRITFRGGSAEARGMRDPFELGLDAMLRFDLMPGHTFMSVYPVMGLGTGTLFWDYARPVPVTVDGKARMVEHDRINHFHLFGGVGVTVVRTPGLVLDVIGTGGMRNYEPRTTSGFVNDLLPTTGFFELQFELGFR